MREKRRRNKAGNERNVKKGDKCLISGSDNLLVFVFQEVGLVDYHSHHARDYSSHLAQPHRRRPSLLSEFQPGNER